MGPFRWMSPARHPPKDSIPMTQTFRLKGLGQCHPGAFLPSQAVSISWVPGRAALMRTKGDSYVEGTWGEDILLISSPMHCLTF